MVDTSRVIALVEGVVVVEVLLLELDRFPLGRCRVVLCLVVLRRVEFKWF
jgi:hypothetical protein